MYSLVSQWLLVRLSYCSFSTGYFPHRASAPALHLRGCMSIRCGQYTRTTTSIACVLVMCVCVYVRLPLLTIGGGKRRNAERPERITLSATPAEKKRKRNVDRPGLLLVAFRSSRGSSPHTLCGGRRAQSTSTFEFRDSRLVCRRLIRFVLQPRTCLLSFPFASSPHTLWGWDWALSNYRMGNCVGLLLRGRPSGDYRREL